MRFSLFILFSLCYCSSSLAAPSTFTDQTSSTRLHTFPIVPSSTSDHTSTRQHPHHPQSSLSHEFLPHSRPTPVVGGPLGHLPPRPTRPNPLPPAASNIPEHHQHQHSTQSPIAIFFEALGGFIGLAALASCFRCWYHYNRTPKRDRISAILERHQLERELAELERNPLALRRAHTGEPLPLYVPPPPTYEAAALARPRPASAPAERSGYAEVATISPSSSPTTSPHLPTRQLESAPSVSTIPPQPNIPSVPDG